MRSPAVAFSLLAAATAVSVSASSPSTTTGLDSTTLSPKLDVVDLNGSALKSHAHRRDAGAGLGISGYDAKPPLHLKRAPVGQSHSPDHIHPRSGKRSHSIPHPMPSTGCNTSGTTSEESTTATHATFVGGPNGGVSCSSSSQGSSADNGRQDGSGPDANSPDAGSASGSSVLKSDIDIFNQGQSGGTFMSDSVTGNSAHPSQDHAPASGGKSNLNEAEHGSSTVVTARGMKHATSSDCDKDDIDCDESI